MNQRFLPSLVLLFAGIWPIGNLALDFGAPHKSPEYEVLVKDATEPIHEKEKDAASRKLSKLLNIDHEHEIVFGQSAPLSGPLKFNTKIIQDGINASFKKINASGGIGGKMLRLVTLDDHGNPEHAKRNTKLLSQEFGVDMFLGSIGTRGILSVMPMVEGKKIAQLFPWGVTPGMRSSEISNIVHGTSYIQPQIDALVDHALDDLKFKKIAVVHSNGTFGTQNANWLQSKLKQRGITPVAVKPFNSQTMRFDKIIDDLLDVDPRMIVFLSTSIPAAKCIKGMLAKGPCPIALAGIDSTFLVPERLKDSKFHFSYSSSVPSPHNTSYKLVDDYQKAMKLACGKETFKPNILSLSYFLNASIVTEALKQVEKSKKTFSRDTVMAEIENMKNVDLGGFIADFNRRTRHAYPLHVTIVKG
ncbi:ABC transporter substrate-binding protein [bacterium]|jgi:branched-chain amino acid transport system substrate-binding protein|nr:ABC transporter substrate-binding protein [bacterium]